MKFRTEIEIPKSSAKIGYSTKLLSLGSCFAQLIGTKLDEVKFCVRVNPVGVLFNPCSIASAMCRFEQCKLVDKSELQYGNGRWFHFDFHGSLSDVDPLVALAKMNKAVEEGHAALKQADTIIITLGTAWVYELVDDGHVVANCHKESAQRFVRRALDVHQVVAQLSPIVERYRDKQFIFSLSPIRHLKDGLAENSLSKATLRVAISQIVARYTNAHYFPSYEILIDDLRDYRFYADDMLHPSAKAVDYVWSKFCEAHISQEAASIMERVAAIVRAASHSPIDVASSAHQRFCQQQLDLIKNLPEIDFDKENSYFMSQLRNNL
ncbi:MAG: GSCFA domain-containing protein [Rikenellaceae bacterium]